MVKTSAVAKYACTSVTLTAEGSRVVVIEFWHQFGDYNYLSLNRQLIPITITMLLTSDDYNYRKITKLQIALLNYRPE